MSTRPAARWVTYAGDQTGSVGQVVGPTTLSDYLTIVETHYDAEADTTRVGFAFGILNDDRHGAAFVTRGTP